MHVNIDLSGSEEAQLRKALGVSLSEIVTDSLLINSYRTGRVSLGQLAAALKLPTSLAALQWLADRKIPLNYDLDELEADHRTIREQLGVNL
jgi:predicted HTH domain antitoxin